MRDYFHPNRSMNPFGIFKCLGPPQKNISHKTKLLSTHFKLTRKEDSIYDAYCKSIENASQFIYIENQFFISYSLGWEGRFDQDKNNPIVGNQVALKLVDKIIEKFKRNENFHCFIILPFYPEQDYSKGIHRAVGMKIISHQWKSLNYIYRSLKKITSLPIEEYLSVYCLGATALNKRNMIYVHSKLMVVDDEYLLIGSANINERSLSAKLDTEICVGGWQCSKDGHALKDKVQQFRIQLFREHLGSDYNECCPNDEINFQKIRKIATRNLELFSSCELMPSHLMEHPIWISSLQSTKPSVIITSVCRISPDGKKVIHTTNNGHISLKREILKAVDLVATL